MGENYKKQIHRLLKEVEENLDQLDIVNEDALSEMRIVLSVSQDRVPTVTYSLETDNYLLRNYGKKFQKKI